MLWASKRWFNASITLWTVRCVYHTKHCSHASCTTKLALNNVVLQDTMGRTARRTFVLDGAHRIGSRGLGGSMLRVGRQRRTAKTTLAMTYERTRYHATPTQHLHCTPGAGCADRWCGQYLLSPKFVGGIGRPNVSHQHQGKDESPGLHEIIAVGTR